MNAKTDPQNKTTLVTALRQLLKSAKLTTQEDIKLALHQQGLEINQAQISRLLHQLGAVKVLENNQLIYRLPSETSAFTHMPNTSLHKLIVDIAHNQALIIIHTTPGSAQLIARFLDQHQLPAILGTLAGDDTIFIAPKSIDLIEQLMQQIMQLVHGT